MSRKYNYGGIPSLKIDNHNTTNLSQQSLPDLNKQKQKFQFGRLTPGSGRDSE